MSMNKGNEERRQALLALADSLKARHEQAFDDAYTVDFPEAIRSLANAIEDIEQALRAIAQEAGDE